MLSNTYDMDKRKLLSALSHGSIFLSALLLSIGIPIGILLISDDPVVKGNAKEAINFHFNVWLYGIILGILWFTIILIPLAWIGGGLLLILSWVLPILAIFSCLKHSDASYRYPFIFRIL